MDEQINEQIKEFFLQAGREPAEFEKLPAKEQNTLTLYAIEIIHVQLRVQEILEDKCMETQDRFAAEIKIIDRMTALEYTLLYPSGFYNLQHMTDNAVLLTFNSYERGEQWLPLSIIAADNNWNLYILNEFYEGYK